MTKISEAGREIIKKWQEMGVIFFYAGDSSQRPCNFEDVAEEYSIPEQPLPQGISRGWLTNAEELGIRVWLDYKTCQYFTHAQPIPKELLEMEEPKKDILIHHPEERMLWLQQRIAGTNEQWRAEFKGAIFDIEIATEPEWDKNTRYYPKPKKVKFYFCAIRHKSGSIGTYGQYGSKEELKSTIALGGATIIGNIEERDVEV